MKSIFIHIAKCGGMSMESICRKNNILIDPLNNDESPDSPHPSLSDLNNTWDTNLFTSIENEPSIDFSFTFIRNPFPRLVSAWKCPWVTGPKFEWVSRTPKEALKFVPTQKRFNNQFEKGFADFVKRFVAIEKDWNFYRWSHVMPFTDPRTKLFNNKGEQIIDYIGKLETYQQDFDQVCDKIGIPKQSLPHSNKTKHKHYTEYYDLDTLNLVKQIYKNDLDCFGYKFGD